MAALLFFLPLFLCVFAKTVGSIVFPLMCSADSPLRRTVDTRSVKRRRHGRNGILSHPFGTNLNGGGVPQNERVSSAIPSVSTGTKLPVTQLSRC